jgi:hypothetical protein
MSHHRWVRRALSVVTLVLAASGCSGSSNDDDDDGNGDGAACQQWQVAICDFVEGCGVDATTCRAQAPAISCLSEAEAQRCSGEFATATCSAPPTGCDVTDIADPAPAVEKCNGFIEALCNRSEECEAGTHDDCVVSGNMSLDCSTAIGIKQSYDQCITDIATLACDAANAPASCQGVVLLN